MKREESMYAKKRGAWQELRSALYYMGAAAEQRPTEPSLEGGAAEPRPMGHSLEERPVMEELWGIDERLGIYFEELGSDKWDDGQDCNTRHNYYEICGGLRFLRFMLDYELDTEKVRKVIRLRELGECSIQEIMEATGLSAENVRVLLSRARKALRNQLQTILST